MKKATQKEQETELKGVFEHIFSDVVLNILQFTVNNGFLKILVDKFGNMVGYCKKNTVLWMYRD